MDWIDFVVYAVCAAAVFASVKSYYRISFTLLAVALVTEIVSIYCSVFT